jgi:hypothetical protein
MTVFMEVSFSSLEYKLLGPSGYCSPLQLGEIEHLWLELSRPVLQNPDELRLLLDSNALWFYFIWQCHCDMNMKVYDAFIHLLYWKCCLVQE